MAVILTPQARDDLRRIALFIARDNPARARSFVADLRAEAGRLATMPRAFPLVPRYEQQGIRRRSWRGYGILYMVAEAGAGGIVIVRFLGPGQDHDRALRLS
ncbi:type II toxin-antitoxin system RelE/ParE family toxin (plasmid) [Croceibacterium sp. TMG7-5b_MA50]|uniref:type II toxin-antitoxin system RelE/ParE family toxin n=1 Tax=Croceibacterium sp. TMG7-5b_MA50 TaxID=3121290 RepID=UPI00322153E0